MVFHDRFGRRETVAKPHKFLDCVATYLLFGIREFCRLRVPCSGKVPFIGEHGARGDKSGAGEKKGNERKDAERSRRAPRGRMYRLFGYERGRYRGRDGHDSSIRPERRAS